MKTDDGWICDPEDASAESWMSDAPWVKANDRHGYYFLVRTKVGVSNCYSGMAHVTRGGFLKSLIYGNPVQNPGEMTGFSSFYNNIDPNLTQNAVNIIDADGRGPVSSLWAIAWGPGKVFMVTPDGLPPVGGGEAALVVADWRFAVRVANIPLDISADDLRALASMALIRLPIPPVGPPVGASRNVRLVIYANPHIGNMFGSEYFRGIFIRGIDDISLAEDRVGGSVHAIKRKAE